MEDALADALVCAVSLLSSVLFVFLTYIFCEVFYDDKKI